MEEGATAFFFFTKRAQIAKGRALIEALRLRSSPFCQCATVRKAERGVSGSVFARGPAQNRVAGVKWTGGPAESWAAVPLTPRARRTARRTAERTDLSGLKRVYRPVLTIPWSAELATFAIQCCVVSLLL